MDNRSAALPLLLQMFYTGDVADGDVVSDQFETTVDRGDAYKIITIANFAPPVSVFNLKIGSQPIYYNQMPLFFLITGNYWGNWTKYTHPIKFKGGQIMNWDISVNNGLGLDCNMAFGVYYMYDWLLEWRKNLQITNKLTTFRQGFEKLTTLINIEEISHFQISKSLGDPIGFRFLILGTQQYPDDVRWNVYVNGVKVIQDGSQNIACLDTDPTLTEYYLPLPPGGQISVGVTNPSPVPFYWYLEIIYNDGKSN